MLFYIKCLVDWLHGQLVVWSFDCLSFRFVSVSCVLCCVVLRLRLHCCQSVDNCRQLRCYVSLCFIADTFYALLQIMLQIVSKEIHSIHTCFVCECVFFDDFVHSQFFFVVGFFFLMDILSQTNELVV